MGAIAVAWYQRAKDKARIGELEEELGRIKGRYAELVNVLGESLTKLRLGAVDEALHLLETEYKHHEGDLEDQSNSQP